VCRTGFISGFWEGHGFTGCGKSRVLYQGMPSGIPQVAQNQSRLQALAHEFILFPQPL
jgi:hypothetical protein